MPRLHALFILARALVRTLLSRVGGGRRGLAAFEESYARDHLAPVSPEERRRLPAIGGCIACGLCDFGEGAPIAASGGRYAGVMDLALASGRSFPDADAALRSFAEATDERLAQVEALCPGRVPLRALSDLVRRHGAAAPQDQET